MYGIDLKINENIRIIVLKSADNTKPVHFSMNIEFTVEIIDISVGKSEIKQKSTEFNHLPIEIEKSYINIQCNQD